MGRGRSKGSNSGGAKSANSKKGNQSYQTFDDKARDELGFYGDGKKQDDFFQNNSNMNSLIGKMSEEDKEEFESWVTGDYMSGYQYDGWDNMMPAYQRGTAIFDKYLDQATLEKGVTLARLSDAQLILGSGNKKPSLKALQAMEGKTVVSKGSMSFSAADEGLQVLDFEGKKTVEYKLHIPGGTIGAGMYIGDIRINSLGNDQREFMTNRDVAYKVGKTKYNSSRGVYEVEIFYEGRLPHDYGTKGHP